MKDFLCLVVLMLFIYSISLYVLKKYPSKKNKYETIKLDYVSYTKVDIEDHTYIIWGMYGSMIIHDPSCPCMNNKERK